MLLQVFICSLPQGKWLSIPNILDNGEMKTDACVSTELFIFKRLRECSGSVTLSSEIA